LRYKRLFSLEIFQASTASPDLSPHPKKNVAAKNKCPRRSIGQKETVARFRSRFWG
jgi:hypothetical protein